MPTKHLRNCSIKPKNEEVSKVKSPKQYLKLSNKMLIKSKELFHE